MSKILTNSNNVATIKTVSPNSYRGGVNDKTIDVSGITNKNDFYIPYESDLSPSIIRQGTTIWNVDGTFKTPSNSGQYGSVYLNYDNNTSRDLWSYTKRTSSDYYAYGGWGYTYCGFVGDMDNDVASTASYTSAYLLGAYDGYLFFGASKYVSSTENSITKLWKYNLATNSIVWEVDLSSYIRNSIYGAKFFATDNCIFLAVVDNSIETSKVISLLQDGTVVSKQNIGTDVANSIAMDVQLSSSECHLYIHQSGGVSHYFYHMIYNATTGAFISQTNSGKVETYYGEHVATFDSDHNCISWTIYRSNPNYVDICVFNASDCSVYMHYYGGEIWDKLTYGRENSNFVLMNLNFAGKYLAVYYGYGDNGDMAMTYMAFTSSGLGDVSYEKTYDGLGAITVYTITRDNHMKASGEYYNSGYMYYYGTDTDYKRLVKFSTNPTMYIYSTQSISSPTIHYKIHSPVIVDRKSNIIYSASGNKVYGFRDNSVAITTGYLHFN